MWHCSAKPKNFRYAQLSKIKCQSVVKLSSAFPYLFLFSCCSKDFDLFKKICGGSWAEPCHTQSFYLRWFKSDFDAVKSELDLLILVDWEVDLKSLYLLNTRVVTCRAVGLCGFRNSLLVFQYWAITMYFSRGVMKFWLFIFAPCLE